MFYKVVLVIVGGIPAIAGAPACKSRELPARVFILYPDEVLDEGKGEAQGPVKVRKVPRRGTRSLAVGETDGRGGATAAVRFL